MGSSPQCRSKVCGERRQVSATRSAAAIAALPDPMPCNDQPGCHCARGRMVAPQTQLKRMQGLTDCEDCNQFRRRNLLLWPEGRQSAVALAFDVDGPTGDAMLDGSLLSKSPLRSHKAPMVPGVPFKASRSSQRIWPQGDVLCADLGRRALAIAMRTHPQGMPTRLPIRPPTTRFSSIAAGSSSSISWSVPVRSFAARRCRCPRLRQGLILFLRILAARL